MEARVAALAKPIFRARLELRIFLSWFTNPPLLESALGRNADNASNGLHALPQLGPTNVYDLKLIDPGTDWKDFLLLPSLVSYVLATVYKLFFKLGRQSVARAQ